MEVIFSIIFSVFTFVFCFTEKQFPVKQKKFLLFLLIAHRNKRNFFILIFSGLEETIIFSCYACTSVIFPLQCIFRIPSGIVSLSPASTQMLPIKPLPDAT